MSEKWKPCPFCGNHAVEARKFPLINRIGFYCDICGNVSFFGDECKDFSAIVKKWNRRVENKRVMQACEYLKKCLKNFDFDDGEEMTSLEGDIMSFLKDVAVEVNNA